MNLFQQTHPRFRGLLILANLLLANFAIRAETSVFQADFEAPAPAGPPAGWSMWGAAGKIPEFRHPVNGHRLYRRDDLTKILQQIEQTATPVPRRKR